MLPSKSKFSVADRAIIFVTSGSNANPFVVFLSSKRMERIRDHPASKRLPGLEQDLLPDSDTEETAKLVQRTGQIFIKKGDM